MCKDPHVGLKGLSSPLSRPLVWQPTTRRHLLLVQIFLPTCVFICIRSTNVGIQIQIQRAAQPAQSRAQRGSDQWSGAQRCPCRQGTLGTECLLFTRTPRAAQLAGSHVLDIEEENSRIWDQESEPPVPHRKTVEQGLCETTWWGRRPWPGRSAHFPRKGPAHTFVQGASPPWVRLLYTEHSMQTPRGSQILISISLPPSTWRRWIHRQERFHTGREQTCASFLPFCLRHLLGPRLFTRKVQTEKIAHYGSYTWHSSH